MNGIIAETDSALNWALRYSRLGWCIIPVKVGMKRPVPNRWREFQTRRSTEAELRRWWKRNERYGLAVMLGEVSGGLVARDFDSPEVYEAFRSRYRDAAETLPTVATSAGRRHVYCLSEPRQAQERFGSLLHNFGDGNGELRAGNGIVIIPPTRHPSGARYEWINGFPEHMPFVPDLAEIGFFDSFSEERAAVTNGTYEEQRTTDDVRRLGGGGGECVNADATTSNIDSEALAEAVELAIRATLPNREGIRRSHLFQFGRRLVSIPGLSGKSADDLKPHVQRWWEQARSAVRDKPWICTWTEFCGFWDARKIRVPYGAGMSDIVHEAKSAVCELLNDSYEYTLLVEICRALQRKEGPERPFFLDCRTAATHIGVDHKTAWKWLKVGGLLESEGWLKCVEVGRRGKSSRYLFLRDFLMQKPQCPACGSTNIRHEHAERWQCLRCRWRLKVHPDGTASDWIMVPALKRRAAGRYKPMHKARH